MKMTETRIAFLCKAASVLKGVNKTQELLKSYYMMRCKEISKGYGLPQNHFSNQVRCSHCCLEWKKGSEINLKPIKLSRRQRKRINADRKTNKVNKKHLLHSNEMERICTFCGHSTKTVISKPRKTNIIIKPQTPVKEIKAKKKNNKTVNNKSSQLSNIYSNTVQVFSLKNNKNMLQCKLKQEPKIIKNNKKKKDRFAGLCHKAVLAAAKLKHKDSKKDKLKLFLKPSA